MTRTSKKARKAGKTAQSRSRTRGARIRGAWPRRWFRRLIALAVCVVLAPFALGAIYILINPVSTLMLSRAVSLERVVRDWVPLEQVDERMIRSVIASEDARFCSHGGVDWDAVRQVVEDYRAGRRPRGASTITMQTVKNLFLWPQRSFIRKGLEVPLALYLDAVLGKHRVLEIYLNIAEWGPDGEFGVEAGSQRAFGKSAIDLVASEAALLTTMLPNPIRRDARSPSARQRRTARTIQSRVASSALDVSCVGLR